MAKIGEGSLEAAARQGLREVRAALYADSNVAQPAEYGMYGTKTPGEIAEDRRGDERDLEDERSQGSVISGRLMEGADRAPEEARGHDWERD